jgi:hypothetical protein
VTYSRADASHEKSWSHGVLDEGLPHGGLAIRGRHPAHGIEQRVDGERVEREAGAGPASRIELGDGIGEAAGASNDGRRAVSKRDQ